LLLVCHKNAPDNGYVASKHAMQGFFDTLRMELRSTGVDVDEIVDLH
jgi:short-subunit dehydrogenase